MAIEIACPECGTRDVTTARAHNFKQKLQQFAGIYNLRCKRCNARFRGALWRPGLIWYASCPKCCRTQLTTWSEQYYHPPTWTVVKLRLGATPYRCNHCRCNFASFRACKERIPWQNNRTSQSQPQPGAQARS